MVDKSMNFYFNNVISHYILHVTGVRLQKRLTLNSYLTEVFDQLLPKAAYTDFNDIWVKQPCLTDIILYL